MVLNPNLPVIIAEETLVATLLLFLEVIIFEQASNS